MGTWESLISTRNAAIDQLYKIESEINEVKRILSGTVQEAYPRYDLEFDRTALMKKIDTEFWRMLFTELDHAPIEHDNHIEKKDIKKIKKINQWIDQNDRIFNKEQIQDVLANAQEIELKPTYA